MSRDATDGTRRVGAGRPRDVAIDAAVLETVLPVIAETGYRRFSIEEVARRAGTTKPAIYRRWPTRQQLVLAALGSNLSEVQPPDTGCTICDLVDAIGLFVAVFGRLPADLLGSLLADCSHDPELRTQFMTTLFDPPRDAVAQTLAKALGRGDLREDVDLELVLDLLGSLVHYRAVFGHAPTAAADIERAVEALLQGVATDYQQLLEHSRQSSGDPQTHHLHA